MKWVWVLVFFVDRDFDIDIFLLRRAFLGLFNGSVVQVALAQLLQWKRHQTLLYRHGCNSLLAKNIFVLFDALICGGDKINL